jgi:plastocyanin
MRRIVLMGLVCLLAAGGSDALAVCTGDCNGDGYVRINEVVTGVSIGLQILPLAQCEAADASGNGSVAINEVIAAVNHGLTGCPAGFAGSYSGSAVLDTDRTATIELEVDAGGRANGVVIIDDPTVPQLIARGPAGGGAGTSRVDVVGSVDLETGAFSVTGSYHDPNGPTLEVEVSGVLPFGGQPGSLSIRIGPFTYTGSFGGSPTRTPTPTSTPAGNVRAVEVGKPSLPFDPELVEIDPGDAVVWTWVGGTHSVVSSAVGGSFPSCNPDGRFDSGEKTSGTFSYTFTAPGTYEYHCGVAGHCESFETGVVIVRGSPTPTVTRTPTTIPTPTLTPTPETIGGVSTAMLGIFAGTATNDFGDVFAARLQITVDVEVVHVTDLEGTVLGVGGQLTMTVESPTKLTFENPDPFFMRSLTLELDAPGHVTGSFRTGSMGMGTFGLALDLTKE